MTRDSYTPAAPPPSDAIALEASIDAANASAADRALEWLGLYLPSCGTSVVLHVAVLVLAAFLISPFTAPPPPQPEITGFIVPKVEPTPVERRSSRTDPAAPRRRDDRPRGPSLAQSVKPSLVPDVAANSLAVLHVLGDGGGGRDIGTLAGPATNRIFTIPSRQGPLVPAARIVFVVDRSGSMTDSLGIVKMELRDTLMELDEDTEFHIIFYSSGPPLEMPTRRLVRATPRNKTLAMDFIDGVIAMGETDPARAIDRAFAVRPDLVYLLTDGEFDRAVIGQIGRLNAGGKVRVYTIGFLYTSGEEVLKEIAAGNGGLYRFVSQDDLAALGGP